MRPLKDVCNSVKVTRNHHFWRVRSIRNPTTQNGRAHPINLRIKTTSRKGIATLAIASGASGANNARNNRGVCSNLHSSKKKVHFTVF